MEITEVCRLCSKNENLIWVFDEGLNSTKNMKEIVFTTTGVEILAKDMISQKICEECHKISIKMFQFRQQSQENDNYLKETYEQHLENNRGPVEAEPKKEIAAKLAYKIHPSINELFNKYPQMKLPTVCLPYHIEPCVSMEMDAVENYFKKNNFNIQKYTQQALKWDKKIAKKKTSTKTLSKNVPEGIELNHMQNRTKISNKNDSPQIPPEPVASTSSASTDSEKEKIHPIAIKRNQGKNSHCYKIVKVSKKTDSHQKSDEDSVRSPDDSAPSTSKKRKHGKRKLSDIDLFTDPEVKKPSIIEAVGLTPKKPVSEAGTLYVEKSVAIFICTTCNSIQYSEKGLKKHQEKHLRCQFCKAKFKNMDLKNQHIQSSCLIKNMMNNFLPSIPLEKVDNDVTIREAYRTAFKDFPRIVELKQLKVAETPRDDMKTDASTTKSDIIEILSDESNVKEETPRNAVTSESGNVTSTSNPIPITATTTSTPIPSTSANPNVCLPSIPEMSVSSSVVKPDINIKNNNVLEILDLKAGEIRAMKELLLKCENIKLKDDSSTQTELPSSDSINVNQEDRTAKMKHLKHSLYAFKVPVEIKKGSFNVEYSYQQVQKRQKKLDLWNDMVAVDVDQSSRISAANGSAPVDLSQPNSRLVSGDRTNHSSAVNSHIGNSSSTSTSTIPLPTPKNSVIVSPMYDVSNYIIPTIPQASNLKVPRILHNVQEMSNFHVPRPLPYPTVSSSNASSPYLAMKHTNSYPLPNYALNNGGVIQMKLLNDRGTAPKSVASTKEAVSVPLAGTIRVKNFLELI